MCSSVYPQRVGIFIHSVSDAEVGTLLPARVQLDSMYCIFQDIYEKWHGCVLSWVAGAIRNRMIRTALDIAPRMHSSGSGLGAGWYRHVPGEDRGSTRSVRVHRLVGVHVGQRGAPAPARATPPLINRTSSDNWSSSPLSRASCIIGAWLLLGSFGTEGDHCFNLKMEVH